MKKLMRTLTAAMAGALVFSPAASAAVRSFILTTANDAPERDPASYALVGTNDPIVSNDNSNGSGENWTLVSSGLVNLPTARGAAGPAVSFTNATGFSSYRMVMTSLKNTATATSMQIAEVQFFTQAGGAGAGVLAPSNFIIAVQTGVSASSSPLAESPANAIDGNTATKYLNFGKRNTGFIVTPSSGPQAVQSIRLTTANDSPDRDPITWVLVGTNDPIRSLDHSEGNAENWTFIAKGTTGLTTGRFEEGPVLSFANATPWKSYRLIFPTVRNFAAANSMQIAEVQFFPDRDGVGIPVVVAGDPILGVQLLSSNSNSPAAESAQMAIDGQASTKYLNFGRERSGIIVTPLTGPTVATGFTITTANDAPARDPAAWELYGTNEEILSANHSEGDLENWTLISSGVLDLPMDRGVDSAPVVFTNATSWNSYRFLVRTVRDPAVANSVQFGEFQLEGTVASPGVPGFLISRVTATGSPVQSVQITFGSEPGRSYGVQASTSLSSSGSWAAVGTVNATGSQTTATVNLGAFPAFSGQPRVFFRIRNS